MPNRPSDHDAYCCHSDSHLSCIDSPAPVAGRIWGSLICPAHRRLRLQAKQRLQAGPLPAPALTQRELPARRPAGSPHPAPRCAPPPRQPSLGPGPTGPSTIATASLLRRSIAWAAAAAAAASGVVSGRSAGLDGRQSLRCRHPEAVQLADGELAHACCRRCCRLPSAACLLLPPAAARTYPRTHAPTHPHSSVHGRSVCLCPVSSRRPVGPRARAKPRLN